MAGAAGKPLHNVIAWRRGRSAKFFNSPHQRRIMKYSVQIRSWNTQLKDGSVAIDLRSDRGIQSIGGAQFLRQGLHSGMIPTVTGHQDVRDRNFQSLGLQKSNSIHTALE